jgi:threonine/homoserine efflux transporter RhtA
VRVGWLARVLRSERKRVAVAVVVAALGGGVVVAHGALGMDHMGDDMGVCVAVLNAGLFGTGLVMVHRSARPAPSRHPLVLLRPAAALAAPAPRVSTRSRAGPADLQVFRS